MFVCQGKICCMKIKITSNNHSIAQTPASSSKDKTFLILLFYYYIRGSFCSLLCTYFTFFCVFQLEVDYKLKRQRIFTRFHLIRKKNINTLHLSINIILNFFMLLLYGNLCDYEMLSMYLWLRIIYALKMYYKT